MPPLLPRPGADGPVDLAEHPLEAGLLRLAVLGAEGFALRFDDPALVAAATRCLGAADGEAGPWDEAALKPYAARGLRVLEKAARDDPRLARLLTAWRPRALRLAGLVEEATGEERLRLRLEDRLAALAAQVLVAREAGDEDLAQALHARYIELGTTYAGRLARTW